jgi:hypothetical protein
MAARNIYRIDAGDVATPMYVYVARAGAWRPVYVYSLPAEAADITGRGVATSGFTGRIIGDARTPGKLARTVGFSATMKGAPVSNQATTVITISDLLASSESWNTTNNTVTMQNCLNRLIRKTGSAQNITTSHVTVDFENTFFRCEDPLIVPGDGYIATFGITHPCKMWPGGMTWQNGGIYATTDDGTLGVGTNGKNRNRFQLHLQQAIKRPTATNQRFVLRNFWIKGPHTYAKPNYDLQREGQEALGLIGMQHVLLEDCQIEETWGDAVFLARYDPPGAGGSHLQFVLPGGIEILGGRFQRIGRIFLTMNLCCAPDAVLVDNYWRNPGDGTGLGETGLDILPEANDAPSASGTQYGIWWHGNAAHPVRAIDCSRSCIDVEPVGYEYVNDVRIGADTNRLDFQITGRGDNLFNIINSWALANRIKLSRITRHSTSGGGLTVRVIGSPKGGAATTTVALASHGQVLTGTFDINIASTSGWNPKGVFECTILGTPRLIRWTSRVTNKLVGCSVVQGGTTGSLTTGLVITERFLDPERPKRVIKDFEISDCVFTGGTELELDFRRVDGVVIRRNVSNYLLRNNPTPPFSEILDCTRVDKGGTGFGDNQFTGI